MAEEKLGTLQYDMLVDQKKLEQQLDDITKKLQEKDKQWKEILSGQGNVVSPKINVADLGNLTKANEAVSNSLTGLGVTWKQFVKERMSEYMKLEGGHAGAMKRMSIEWKDYQQSLSVNNTSDAIATSIKKLEVELKSAINSYKKLSEVERNSEGGRSVLESIQKQKDQLNEYNKTLLANIQARKDAARAAADQTKLEASSKQALESQRSKAFVKSNLDDERQLTAEIKKQESALRSLEAQRSKAFVSGNLQKEKELTAEIKAQQAAMRSLEAQRSKAFVSAQNKALREEQQLLKASWQEQKLKIAVDNQAAGSIERLRAQYALLKFQLSQVKFTDPNAVANVNKLQTAIRGVKSEIQALQPTLGIWGKLKSAIQTYATAYISVQAVMGLGRAVYNQTKELDSLNFSMKTVIKSSTELAQTQKFLADVAVNYGGDLLTLSERYIKFRAAAVQSNVSAGETQKIFESVSKAAGTLGLKTDELSGVYLALEQMLSKGKVTTEELRRQLGERLPGAFGIMANALGVTIPELDKLLKKGEILSTVALPKFAAALEKAYGIESLKKIDTLAAAQGRLSTEFTGFIKALDASANFKNTINALAGFIGFIKDNIGAIGFFTKAIIGTTGALYIYKAAMFAFTAVSKLFSRELTIVTLTTGRQIIMAKEATVAQNMLSNAMIRGKVAFNNLAVAIKANWIGLLITGLTMAVSWMFLFKKSSEETADAMGQLNKDIDDQRAVVYGASKVLNNAAKGTEQYKEALQQLNTIALRYNQTLLTEKSTRDEVNSSIEKTLDNLDLEYLKKRKVIELEGAQTAVTAATDPLQAKLFEYYKEMPGGAEKAALAYKEFIQQVSDGTTKLVDLPNTVTKTFGRVTNEAIKAIVKFNEEKKRIEANYPADEKALQAFDVTSIDKAKKEFEEFDLFVKNKAEKIITSFSYKDEKTPTFVSWVNKQIEDMKTGVTKFDADTLKELYKALFPDDKKDTGSKAVDNRNEAIKRLNDKYLADQEDFANYEMGIQSTRIANMEDGLDKEIKLNELAYENRIKAIEKEKIATVKLLNEAAGVKGKIVGFDATGYSKEVQDAATAARDADLQKRKNAENDLRESNLRAEKDYNYKIAEIRRDVNDQFLSGIEKEMAAVNEKYDDWAKKARDNAQTLKEIDRARLIATTDLNIDAAIDRLKFEEEIEYKKNEIKNFGDAKRRKKEAEDFAIYKRTQLRIADALRGKGTDEERSKGLLIEQNLILDEQLFKIKQERELESDILEGAQKISEEYIKQAGLTGESAENLQLAVSTLQSIAKGDYLSAALGVLSKIFTSFSTENENEMLEYFEQLKVKISAVVDKISTLNSVLAKMGSTSSVIGVKLLQSEMSKLANDAARLNEQLKEIADSEKRRGSITQGATTNGGRSDATEIESSRKRIVTDLIKQTDYLNQQIIMLSNKLLDPNLTEDQRKAVESVLNGYIEIVDAIDASIQSITGTSINELSNSIVDAFLAGENAAEAWGNKVTDIIRYMVKQQLVAQLLTKPITQAIQTLVADSEDTLTPEEALKFKDTIRGITEDVSPAIAAAAEAMKQVGIDLSSTTTSSGISKGIQALTEDTGRRLEGLINSIRESGVINIGNTKQLVESSQMIQGYAAQSLGHLRNIDATTAAQLTLFNEIMTSASGTGGKGIKVYVQ